MIIVVIHITIILISNHTLQIITAPSEKLTEKTDGAYFKKEEVKNM